MGTQNDTIMGGGENMKNSEYLANYEKENLRQIRLKINRKTEPEMLEWIEKQGNIQGYIKRLIRREMPQKAELRNQTWFCLCYDIRHRF